ncbi:hypothetical protein KLEP7_gp52 [Pseudaeromonas phage vB_PpeM_ KLEP7]|nr:hypothetical protein KLEP7_gp52 [Pseudaeromonas phage vB_PpeM_ KLEP7]
MSFLYSTNNVFYDGLYLGEHIQIPVIYIKDYQKNWVWVHTDTIFDLWFERGLLCASVNEQILFGLEFGDLEYFKLLSFVNMLEKRIEEK